MLILCYNIIQITGIAIFWPLLLVFVLAKVKYRRRTPARLGIGLAKIFSRTERNNPTFWIHALSVGEITSALPLTVGLRKKHPDSCIVITTSTETGEAVANKLLAGIADHILSAPLDALPVVKKFINTIQPDLYILVETDFWPNLLAELNHRNIPTLLVNGRISQKSFNAYRKFPFFFLPMFQNFKHICMQTETDKESMKILGIEEEKLHTLGNLKYDTPTQSTSPPSGIKHLLPDNRVIFVAGSTHRGEEKILLHAYNELHRTHPELYLVLAPRNPARAAEIIQLGRELMLHGVKRTENSTSPGDYLLVDTIGELVELYQYCHIAFAGGSLVAAGGHNPIEPAIMSLPVLFGPHMEDFQEIASDLVNAGGAVVVSGNKQLTESLIDLVNNAARRRQMGLDARSCVTSQQGVISSHTDLISSLL